jgi:hypothetical protein
VEKARGFKRVLPAAAILGWFLWRTWKGLLIGLDGDDLMNIYQAWRLPAWKLALANLTPFTSIYRPLGSAVYRGFYTLFGIDPLPYRILAYVLMVMNLALVFWLVRKVSDSTETAVWTTLLWSYHDGLKGIYTSNGTIYDVLCFTFYLWAFGIYVGIRKRDARLSDYVLFFACYVLALNSKEMAVTLPAVLFAYEVIYFGGFKLLQRRAWIACVVVTAVAIFAKTSKAAAFTGIPDYKLHISLRQYFSTQIPLLRELFLLRDGSFNTFKVVTLLVLVCALALAMRNKTMLMAAALILVLPLPINFITYRGFFVMYLPLLGWALYLGALLEAIRVWLWKGFWKLPEMAEGVWGPHRIGLFFAILLFILWVNPIGDGVLSGATTPDQILIAELKDGVDRVRREKPSPHRTIFLHDGLPPENWNPLYTVRLVYRDPDIVVDRSKNLPADVLKSNRYDIVFDYCGHRYEDVSDRTSTCVDAESK